MNSSVLFLAKGKNVHPRLRVTNLVNRYGLPEGSFAISNKASYMDDETWAKVVKLIAPGIRKMKVSNVACVLIIISSTYTTIRLYPSKLSADNT